MQHKDAELYLKAADKKLKPIIERVGACALSFTKRNRFDVLANSIIGQQLSVKAARTIKNRVYELLGDHKNLEAEHFTNIEIPQLRGCGLSNAKASYILRLAKNSINGTLDLNSLHKHTDDEILNVLTQQKGVGSWTAEMFMIFALGRPDILSTTDAGLLRSAQSIYKTKEKPTAKEFTHIAEKWKPYRSIASWYLWRYLDA